LLIIFVKKEGRYPQQQFCGAVGERRELVSSAIVLRVRIVNDFVSWSRHMRAFDLVHSMTV